MTAPSTACTSSTDIAVLGAPSNRWIPGLLLSVLASLLTHGWIAAFDYSASTFSDSLDYLMMADFYRAALYGGSLEDAASFYRSTRFPPLFPMLLGVFGGDSEHQHAASIVSNLIAVLACLLVWVWSHRTSASTVVATLITVSTVLLPAWFTLNLTPVSEPLGLLLATSAFILLGTQAINARRVFVAALLVGIAPLARTALLPLVIAFAIWLFVVRPVSMRSLVAALVVSWAPYASWSVYRSLIGSTQYTHYLSPKAYADAGIALPQALWEQPLRLVDALVAGWNPWDGGGWILALGWVLLLLAALGCIARMRRMQLDAWFLAGYIALILIWPYPKEFTRFLVAVYPCILLCAATGVQMLVTGPKQPVDASRSTTLAVGMMMGLALSATVPTLMRYAHRATLPVADELLGDKREFEFFNHPTDLDALAAAEITGRSRLLLIDARQLVPEDACIYGVLPQFTRLYSDRTVRPYPLDLYTERGHADEKLSRCDFFVIGSWQFTLYDLPSFYPAEEFGGWTQPLLASEMEIEGRSHLVAALFRRNVPAEAPAPESASEPP
ncbi:MAG: hypothetical protein KDJ14_17295 [Xanthomonadales bacterium]|nr:hypothetical protein [Xanthomonadales bacterium]